MLAGLIHCGDECCQHGTAMVKGRRTANERRL
jgi:hypothetical protein